MYYLYDVESGEPFRVSKEVWEAHNKFMESMMPKNMKGQYILYGTSGDFDNTNTFKELFCNPKSYNIDDGKTI